MSANARPTGGDKAVMAKKQYFRRKRVARLSDKRLDEIDYKNVDLLKQFITDRGKIVPRRISGVSQRVQRRICEAIKRARNIALLPFAGNVELPERPERAERRMRLERERAERAAQAQAQAAAAPAEAPVASEAPVVTEVPVTSAAPVASAAPESTPAASE
jgi:small subunit ribosomal protein S18